MGLAEYLGDCFGSMLVQMMFLTVVWMGGTVVSVCNLISEILK